jgi:hypothetical protein
VLDLHYYRFARRDLKASHRCHDHNTIHDNEILINDISMSILFNHNNIHFYLFSCKCLSVSEAVFSADLCKPYSFISLRHQQRHINLLTHSVKCMYHILQYLKSNFMPGEDSCLSYDYQNKQRLFPSELIISIRCSKRRSNVWEAGTSLLITFR